VRPTILQYLCTAHIDQKTPRGGSNEEDLEKLYVAIWSRVLRDITHVHINRKANDWPDYFGALRNLIVKVVSDSGLAAEEKARLTRRLSGRIEDLERFW
jgi:hypothetical protein